MPVQRSVARPRIGLALGSGSARGWAHIGIIDTLLEVGIEPDIVCGTSIGALVGAAYIADRLPAMRDLRKLLLGVRLSASLTYDCLVVALLTASASLRFCAI